jgi:hypothetical protein
MIWGSIMRVALLAAVLILTACATEKTAVAPPPGVDFSGHWKLNVADSDDPLHLQQIAQSGGSTDNSGNSGGRGGRGGGRGGGSQGSGYPTLLPPATPSMSALGEGLRWPGKLLDVQQVGGVVTFSSSGRNRVCQPSGTDKKPPHHSSSDRDAPLRSGRDELPPRCTWSDKTLVVRSSDVDEDRPPYEERYSISEDHQRLVEIVGFRGGRSNGFTMSRVWDRVQQ